VTTQSPNSHQESDGAQAQSPLSDESDPGINLKLEVRTDDGGHRDLGVAADVLRQAQRGDPENDGMCEMMVRLRQMIRGSAPRRLNAEEPGRALRTSATGTPAADGTELHHEHEHQNLRKSQLFVPEPL
jgi:hypothetical protein